MIPWGFVVRTVLLTMAGVIAATCFVLLFGLFDDRVDNKAILSILGPTLHDIVIAFISILSGLAARLTPEKPERLAGVRTCRPLIVRAQMTLAASQHPHATRTHHAGPGKVDASMNSKPQHDQDSEDDGEHGEISLSDANVCLGRKLRVR